jgi:hypothetical protein
MRASTADNIVIAQTTFVAATGVPSGKDGPSGLSPTLPIKADDVG